MPSSESSKVEFYFSDPRLRMTLAGRFTVRVTAVLAYVVLAVTGGTALLADLPSLWALGLLIVLFLGDRLIHLKEAQKHFAELPDSGQVNLAEYLTPAAYVVLERAYDRASLKKTDLRLELWRQLLGAVQVRSGLKRLDVSADELRNKTEGLFSKTFVQQDREEKNRILEGVMRAAAARALSNGQRFIEEDDLFVALGETDQEDIRRLLAAFGLNPEELAQGMIFASAARHFSKGRNFPKRLNEIVLGKDRGLRHRIMNRAWTSRPTPNLDKISIDLTDAARTQSVGFLIGHEAEYRRLREILARPANPNVLLVGEPGIGKQTIVEHLAFDLIKDKVPPALFDRRLVELHISELVAGAPPEDLQARLQEVVSEVLLAGNIILYIPDVHNLVNTSGTAYLSAADALMPILKSDTFPVIGSTYPREFKRLIQPRTDFAGTFETVPVNEISEGEAARLLAYESLLLERNRGVVISFGAVRTAVKLAKKYFRNKFLPASAEELLKSAVVLAESKRDKFIGPEQVIGAAEEKVNVPLHEASAAEAEQLLRLEETIHQRLVDQEEAVKAVADALREYRSGLARPGGPIASFLFVGPTGVGKTELAKILAKLQFGSLDAMVRFDMTEYQDKQSFYRLIGSPDGNVSGALTDRVIQKPFSLILLDEFEKAFPDILNLFLQVLDDGRLTDNLERTVDFSHTIIIATSNAHSDLINQALSSGQSMLQISDYLKAKLTDVFKPELLNRFSRVVVFRELTIKHMQEIAELQLKDLIREVAEQGIELSFSRAAVENLAKLGYEPAFGARPLRRVIESRVRAVLAREILAGRLERGASAKLDFREDKFEFLNKVEV